jgi:methylated-DNA-[protein]-cysteine S-methyltransferase
MIFYAIEKMDAVGELLLVAKEEALVGVYFRDCAHAPAVGADWVEGSGCGILREAAGQIREYLGGARREFSLRVALEGTEFQRAVWREISRIPFGETVTYTALAERVGRADAVRAAGTATGKNPLAIVVPCHRVVGKGGGMCGYAGGVGRKRGLLARENARCVATPLNFAWAG